MNKLECMIKNYPDEELLSADGLNNAILGVTYDKIKGIYILVYSKMKTLEILMNRDEMSSEEAIEYYDFNIEGAYMGEKTPIWVDDDFLDE